jgi:hypothetical protein
VQITAEWADIRRCLDLLDKLRPQHVKLSVDDEGQAALSANAYGPSEVSYLRTRLRAKATKPGAVMVEYSRLRGVIKGARAQYVTIVKSDGVVQVAADDFRARLLSVPLSSEPPTEGGPELCALPLGLFKELLGNVVPYLPKPKKNTDSTPVALVEIDGTTVRAVATNGFGIAISERAIGAAPCEFLVPLQAISHLLGMEGFVLRIRAASEYGYGLTFETETDLLLAAPCVQRFVPYRRILSWVLSQGTTTTITISDKAALEAAIRRTLAVGDSEKPIIECNVEANGKALFVQSGTAYTNPRGERLLEDGAAAVSVVVAGPAIDFSFDAKTFLPFLSKAVAPIVLNVINNTSILDFYANNGQYRYLQMVTKPESRTIGAAAAK